MRIRLFLLVFLSIIFLAGCFGSTNTSDLSSTPAGFHYYAGNEYRILVPNEWEIVSPTAFKESAPKNTLVALRNNIRNSNFTSNVVIIFNNLPSSDMISADYAKALYAKIKDSLNDFKEISADKVKIKIGGVDTDTYYTVSEGREAAVSDLKRLYYISGVKASRAFIALGAMLVSEGDITTKKLETMIKSFEIK